MSEVELRSGSWRHRVTLATGFRQRLSGLRRLPGTSMLLETRSVHGFGMDRPVIAVGIGRDLKVIGSKILHPNRIVGFGRARYILEVPVGTDVPDVGDRVVIDHV